MLRIGLTGGIGSGKTTVADILAALGVDVVDADEIVRTISKPDQVCYAKIINHFGSGILNPDTTINRKSLAGQIFNSSSERKMLESILHPAVRAAMLEATKSSQSTYIILVIPLLTETGFTDIIDRVLVVQTDKKKRIGWIKQRNGLNEQEISTIMSTQANDQERLDIADDVITNNKDVENLQKQVVELDQKYKKLAKQF